MVVRGLIVIIPVVSETHPVDVCVYKNRAVPALVAVTSPVLDTEETDGFKETHVPPVEGVRLVV